MDVFISCSVRVYLEDDPTVAASPVACHSVECGAAYYERAVRTSPSIGSTGKNVYYFFIMVDECKLVLVLRKAVATPRIAPNNIIRPSTFLLIVPLQKTEGRKQKVLCLLYL